jgi:hypothetical protein
MTEDINGLALNWRPVSFQAFSHGKFMYTPRNSHRRFLHFVANVTYGWADGWLQDGVPNVEKNVHVASVRYPTVGLTKRRPWSLDQTGPKHQPTHAACASPPRGIMRMRSLA